MDFYTGPSFCGMAKPPIPAADCKAFAMWFVPKGFMHLAQVTALSAEALCKVVWNTC